MERATGLVHYYYGDGKGKTTAALGLALRAAGADRRAAVVQFLKGSPYSEIKSLEKLGIEVCQTKAVKKFVFQMNDEEKLSAANDCKAALDFAIKAAIGGEYDLVVLDEVTDAIAVGLLDEAALIGLIENHSDKTEIVMTGHVPNEKVVERADYVTEMAKRKHPYDRGIMARKGIEF